MFLWYNFVNKNIKIRAAHRGISEEKLTDNTTSPRKDRKVNRNRREP